MSESIEKFVKVWMQAVREGHTSEWVGKTLGCSSGSARMRASYLRKKHGFVLPKLASGTKPLSKASKAKIAKMIEGGK